MSADADALVKQLNQVLEKPGLVPCLCALAHATRGANDREGLPPGLPAGDRHLGYVREYVANQLMGLAAFWRVHVPESVRR